MNLGAVERTAALIESKQAGLSETDRNFLYRFACATGDKELTEKLFEELSAEENDKQKVVQKYEVFLGNKPDWIRQVENLLVALEMYRLEEEKAVNRLAEILKAYGIELSVEELKEIPQDKIREQLVQKEKLAR